MKNNVKDKTVILFAKKKFGLNRVTSYLKSHFKEVAIFIGKVGDSFPSGIYRKKYDICISFMSPWIIPKKVLDRIREFSINFHPGLPAYRGIGCTNFALYNHEKEYGVTAHLMLPRVDAGKIVSVKYFPILPADSLVSLTQKCYVNILAQFYEVFEYYLKHNRLPTSDEKWSDKLYSRKELNDLCKIDMDMPREEIIRRVQATNFPHMPKAHLSVHGCKFEFKEYIKNE